MDKSRIKAALRAKLIQAVGYIVFAAILTGVGFVFAFKPAAEAQFQSTYTKVVANPVGEEWVKERTFLSKRGKKAVRYVVSEFEYKGGNLSSLGKSDSVVLGQPTDAWVQDHKGELTLHYTERNGASTIQLAIAGAAALILLLAWGYIALLFKDRGRLKKRIGNAEDYDLLVEIKDSASRIYDAEEGDSADNVEIKLLGTVVASNNGKTEVGSEFKIECPATEIPGNVQGKTVAISFIKKGDASGEAIVYDTESKVLWSAYAGKLVPYLDEPVTA